MSSLCEKQGVLFDAQANYTNEQTRFVIKQQDTEVQKKNYYDNLAAKTDYEADIAKKESKWQDTWIRDTERIAKAVGNVVTFGLLPE